MDYPFLECNLITFVVAGGKFCFSPVWQSASSLPQSCSLCLCQVHPLPHWVLFCCSVFSCRSSYDAWIQPFVLVRKDLETQLQPKKTCCNSEEGISFPTCCLLISLSNTELNNLTDATNFASCFWSLRTGRDDYNVWDTMAMSSFPWPGLSRRVWVSPSYLGIDSRTAGCIILA